MEEKKHSDQIQAVINEGFRPEDLNNAERNIYIKTGLGKRYHVSIQPKGERPILVAVHL